ncbi:hypothetical protein C9374_007614 [Naegleria lovaniensis]|uniref:Ubiquinol-cytochrome c chaperone domain-containing protein n=1 Tax=Naegleria lovaniensis TaxID=51637 RepID=A0AA88GKR2_NAELO|nr:uncharacterized protein C9374_007614 [Naegleria lovaniensis]KAG2378976.1 hypothetical protein C9374_007614 [Naegleria lovaniensis]
MFTKSLSISKASSSFNHHVPINTVFFQFGTRPGDSTLILRSLHTTISNNGANQNTTSGTSSTTNTNNNINTSSSLNIIYKELESQRQYYLQYAETRQEADVLEQYNPLVRPFLRAYTNEIRFLVDRYEPLRLQKQLEEDVKQGKVPQKHNVSWVLPSKVAQQENASTSRPLALRLFGFFGQESIINRACDFVWNMLINHVNAIRKSGAYEKTNLAGVSWTGADFYVWTIHLWVLFRRLRFEGSDGDLMSKKLCDRFWNYVEHYINDNYKVNAYTLSKNLKRLQQIHYGIIIQLDKILDLSNTSNMNDSVPTSWEPKTLNNMIVSSSDQDALIAEIVWRNFYCGGVEFTNLDVDDTIKGEVEVTAEDLAFWTRYIRYVLSWTDHIDSVIFIRGLFHYHLPTDDFVVKFKPNDKPVKPAHENK